MAEVDVDHNGKMDLREFVQMMHKMLGNKDKDNMEEIKIFIIWRKTSLSSW